MEELKEYILESNPEIKLDEDIDFALIGYVERAGVENLPVYNKTFLENTEKMPQNSEFNCYAILGLSLEEIAELEPESLLADGYEDAIIGLVELPPDGEKVVLYDTQKCIDILISHDEMTEEDAWDYFYYNTVGAYVGEKTPAFMTLKENFLS